MSSIFDVAREARVAPSTVSLVVNRRGRVSAATRKRVESAVHRLGYKARSAPATRHIGIVYTRNMIVNGTLVAYCRDWFAGIRDCLAKDPAHISVFAGERDIHQDILFTQHLAAGDFDGLILAGAYPEYGYIQRVLEAGVPLVVLDRPPQRLEYSSVCVDHYQSGRLAGQHLLELGHRRIGLFTGRPELFPQCAMRAGVTDVLAQHGMQLAIDWKQVDLPAEEKARALIQQNVTAVIAGGPGAQSLANALHQLHVSIPAQISLIGLDDLALVTDQGLTLTTIGHNRRTMGELAAHMLAQLLTMRGAITNLTATVPSHLIAGQTTAPAPVSTPGSSV